ncbi:AAA family ATPase [Beggiatoa leptomitoformis]|uniref:AAA family ATPase n=1 Tax=Beggiatoa leptomitoformis TaxID=288004 RepID=A0A2N9YDB8_9GAMM|nr:AAA family ATPase [Beggiatoa leptomitoformis]ALG69115.1 AAA family ATPase [Beggiatoa leptomitoformis]AUI68471.1 AAA family ATPase [Beggiatoa leptomitoformis]
MIELADYAITEKIYDGAKTVVYRGYRKKDQQAVIIKGLQNQYPEPRRIAQFHHEYQITQGLNLSGIVKPYGLHKCKSAWVLIFEDDHGESLRTLLDKQAPLDLPLFLELAIQLAHGIGELHIHNIIHKDIKPANIIVNLEKKQVKITDFSISSKFNVENQSLCNPDLLEGTLVYMSPEQTGRMNRTVDYRTDLYSLGVVFYEMLVGHPPFQSEDALELVHCHIAKRPTAVYLLNSDVPHTISHIIMKLLAKTAESRYQSAFGLKADLLACLAQYQQHGSIQAFEFGNKDRWDHFHIPQKLYGREQELDVLLNSFKRVNAGHTEMMLVAGYSGIGKSMLVQEIYKPITQQRGYFSAGKFDQFQRNIPYSAVVKAFANLVRQLLTENVERVTQWRERLLRALGRNGQVVIEVLPEIELIIGKQPPVEVLPPTAAQNRFNHVFRSFLRVFAQPEHPLVLFLDDLQWADSATLTLLELILTDEQTHYLFLIGAYRDNEVDVSHPLMLTLDTLHRAQVTISQITLSALQLVHVTHLLIDTLHSDMETVKPLAELIVQKTQGNPFFSTQFLKTLHQERLFTFDFEQARWQWDIKQIQAHDITDNVVELMIVKLRKLPPATQQVLRLAACVGNQFSLQTLAIIYQHSPKETFYALLPTIQEGLILPMSGLEVDQYDESVLLITYYRFLHDRVQQAAYALIDADQKQSVHLNIGWLLAHNTPTEEKADKLFEIVDHLNLGQPLITDADELVSLARLNLEAGQKAKLATAYNASWTYLSNSRQLLVSLAGATVWTYYYELCYTLHKELIEVAYLKGFFSESEQLIRETIAQAQTVLEKADIYNTLIIQYTMQAQYVLATEAGRQALRLLGIDLPTDNLRAVLLKEMAQVTENLGQRSIAVLLNAPDMQLPEKQIAIRLINNLIGATYFSNPPLLHVVITKSVNLSLCYGNSVETAMGYSCYGIVLGAVLGDYQTAYAFGIVGMKLADYYNGLAQKCKAWELFANMSLIWVRHLREADAISEEAFKSGVDGGELQFAGYTLVHLLTHAFYEGKTLDSVLTEYLPKYMNFAEKTKNQLAIDSMTGYQLIIWNLTGRTIDKQGFNTDQLSEADYLTICHKNKNIAPVCRYYIAKCQVLYLYGEYHKALEIALDTDDVIQALINLAPIAEHNFYTSLIIIACYPDFSPTEQAQYWQRLEANQQQMKRWADSCEPNFLHKYLLIAAEMARLQNAALAAMDNYDQAIASANQYEYTQNEAIANELAAKFWLARGKTDIAQIYMKKAQYGYYLWGATRKVASLEAAYPQLLSNLHENRVYPVETQNTATVTAYGTNSFVTFGAKSQLDLASVIKASQAISGEFVFDQLLSRLMRIAIENAGAEEGWLILKKQGQLVLEAYGSVSLENITLLENMPLEKVHCQEPALCLSTAVVTYVSRTQMPVVLADACQDDIFASDPYTLQKQPKSVLCVPLVYHQNLIGVLYLENNLTTGTFTPERLTVIKLLCSQIAISLENARFIAELEQTRLAIRNHADELETLVTQRTVQLAHANAAITALNQKLSAENSRMGAELEVTQRLQQMLLPKTAELDEIQALEIVGFMQPAEEVGGDYYDVLQQNGRVVCGIGDVTGHGLESGVLMLMVQMAVRTLLENQVDSLESFLAVINRAIYANVQRMQSDKNLSLSLLDYQAGVLRLCGQHEEVLLVHRDGSLERIDTFNLGFPVGLENDIHDYLQHIELPLAQGEGIVLYTDGITEARSSTKQLYGIPRLCAVVKNTWSLGAEAVKQAVINDVHRHLDQEPILDDITLLVIKRR